MAILTLTDSKVYMGAYALGTRLNQISFGVNVDEVDATCFGDGARVTMPGFVAVEYGFQGYFDAATTAQIDPAFEALLAVVDTPLTVSPTAAAVGDVAYMTTATQSARTHEGAVGEMFKISAQGKGSGDPLVRGRILANGAKTATGTGAAVEVVDVTASQYLYGSLHVTAISGTVTPTITVKIQSDVDNTFATATDQITFTAKTAVGAQWATPIAGAITDAFWRAQWTVSGTNPSLTIVCAMGIK